MRSSNTLIMSDLMPNAAAQLEAAGAHEDALAAERAALASKLQEAEAAAPPPPAPPKPYTDDGPGDAASWVAINERLAEMGVAPLPLSPSKGADARAGDLTAPPVALREALAAVLARHAERGRTLQGALAEVEERARAATASAAGEDAARRETAALRRNYGALEQQLEAARAQAAGGARQAAAAARESDLGLASLKQKVAAQAHQLRAREGELQRLQQKLTKELPAAAERKKERARHVFVEAHRREARPSSAADTRTLQIIDAYEAQRTTADGEIAFLRTEVRRLSEELADRTNEIGRQVASGAWAPDGVAEVREQLRAARADAKLAQAATRQAEALGEETAKALKQQLGAARRDAEAAKAQGAAATLQMEARPSPEQWAKTQAALADATQTVKALRSQAVQSRAAAAKVYAAETEEAAAAAVATEAAAAELGGATRDRELGELKLHSLQLLAPATMLRLLQDSCRELRLSDAAALPAALRKMSRALGALPKMEAFIHSVCALVLYEAPPGAAAAPPAEGGVPEQVLATLRGWVASLRELRQLRGCVEELSADVRSRDLVAGEAPTAELKAAPPLSPAELSAAVRELVHQERRALAALDNFTKADLAVRLNPEELLTKILAHFQRLFDVKSSEGVLPKMNELYLYVNEAATFTRVVRGMLGLDAAASVHTLLSQLRRVLDLGVVGAAQPPADDEHLLPGSPDGKGKKGPALPGAPAEAGPTTPAMAAMARDGGAPTTEPHALPQYVAVAAELRRLLGVASLYDLAPATQRMIAEVKTHRETVPQMQALIQQLCHTLAVGNADALLPSVQKLATLRRGGPAAPPVERPA